MSFSEQLFMLLEDHTGCFVLGLTVVALCLAVWNFRLAWKLGRMEKTIRSKADLDEISPKSIEEYIDRMQKLSQMTMEMNESMKTLQVAQRLAVQKIGMVRFNAFDDVGGEQSFSLALLDGRENGLVLSCLFGRSESRVYAKSVNGSKSQHVLSSEEEEAIRIALQS